MVDPCRLLAFKVKKFVGSNLYHIHSSRRYPSCTQWQDRVPSLGYLLILSLLLSPKCTQCWVLVKFQLRSILHCMVLPVQSASWSHLIAYFQKDLRRPLASQCTAGHQFPRKSWITSRSVWTVIKTVLNHFASNYTSADEHSSWCHLLLFGISRWISSYGRWWVEYLLVILLQRLSWSQAQFWCRKFHLNHMHLESGLYLCVGCCGWLVSRACWYRRLAWWWW